MGNRDSHDYRPGPTPSRDESTVSERPKSYWERLRAPFKLSDGKGRIRALLIGAMVVFSLFAARLVDLQLVRGDALASEAKGMRTVTVAQPAERGRIYDRNGTPLALSVPGRDITVDPTLVTDINFYARELSKILDTKEDALKERLKPVQLASGPSRFAYIARAVPEEKWQQVRSLMTPDQQAAEAAKAGSGKKGLPGILSRSASVRTYPSGALGANFLGHTNLKDDREGGGYQGVSGLEQMLDNHLSGEDGYKTYEQSASGKQIPTGTAREKASQPGSSYTLTIDRDMQWATQSALEKQREVLDADSMVAVIMEVKTGNVLALAQSPTDDPGDKNRKAENLRDLPVELAFEPGSTAKVITVSAAIEEGKVDKSTVFDVPNRLPRGGTNFSDDQDHPDYQLTTAGVLAHSSNIGTIQIGETVGPEKLREYHEKFGLGKPSGLGLPLENPGIVLPLDQYSPTSFPTITFGQGISANVVQMADVFATIGNMGVKMTPRIIDSITRPDGTVEQAPIAEGERVVSESTAKQVIEMMEGVVQETGTAPIANIPGYRVAGKTGTAHRYDEKVGRYNGYVASFAGLAPATDPQYVMAVTTINPKGGNHFGSTTGGPVFKEIMAQVLKNERVSPIAEPAPVLQRHTSKSSKGGPWNWR
ncbi:MAG: penicillin-binding protein 2 [Candidatus Nanopelagicales bacterium]